MVALGSPAGGQFCLPPILQSEPATDGAIKLLLAIEPELDCFRGHFVRYPVLPGVVQVAWAVAAAKEHFALPEAVKTLERLKFMYPIQPPATISLTLVKLSASVVQFTYSDEQHSYASGRLVYER